MARGRSSIPCVPLAIAFIPDEWTENFLFQSGIYRDGFLERASNVLQ